MKRLAILVALCALPMAAATPTFIQGALEPSNNGVSACAATSACFFYLPQAVLSGNILVVGCSWNASGSHTMAITDDKSDTFTAAGTSETDSSRIVELFYSVDVTTGPQKIIPTTSAATANVQCWAAEFNNIATSSPVDVTSKATYASSTTAAAGSMTPTVSGDLVVNFCNNDSSVANYGAGNPSGMGLAFADVLTGGPTDMLAMEWLQYNSTSATTPSFTLSASGGGNCVAAAFKTASAGTARGTGIHVDRYVMEGFAANTITSPFSVQFPCTGNLIVLHWIGATGDDISGSTRPTDTQSNTYTVGSAVVSNSSSGDIQYSYAKAVSCATTNKITVTLTVSSTTNCTLEILDISSAAANPLDSGVTCGAGTAPTCTNSGDQTSSGNVTGPTLTPTKSGELLLSAIAVGSNTVNGLSGSVAFHGMGLSCGLGGGSGCAQENNGWLGFLSSSTSSYTPTFTTTGGAVGFWASELIAFLPASATTSNQFPRAF